MTADQSHARLRREVAEAKAQVVYAAEAFIGASGTYMQLAHVVRGLQAAEAAYEASKVRA